MGPGRSRADEIRGDADRLTAGPDLVNIPNPISVAGCGMPTMPGMGTPSVDITELATKGVWELLPCHAPLLPVHGAVLHTGKVLLFAGSGNDELHENTCTESLKLAK